jgi:hypothetical protein
MADMAREWYPELEDRIVTGNPGKYSYQDPGVYTISNKKSKEVLGIKCKSLAEGVLLMKDRPKKETFKDEMDRILELENQGLA